MSSKLLASKAFSRASEGSTDDNFLSSSSTLFTPSIESSRLASIASFTSSSRSDVLILCSILSMPSNKLSAPSKAFNCLSSKESLNSSIPIFSISPLLSLKSLVRSPIAPSNLSLFLVLLDFLLLASLSALLIVA